MTVTLEQQDLLEAIRSRLFGDPEIEAAWLGGSLGRGDGDAFSDVDVVVLTAEGQAAKVGLRYAGEADQITETVLVNTLYGGRVVNVVTADWRRFDLTFMEPADLVRYDAAKLKVLFNRGGHEPAAGTPTSYIATPDSVLPLVREFLRVLGLLPVAAGREEWLLALTGIGLLRSLTLDLMLEENGVGPADRGGALRRNPFLTAEQREALEGLSPVAADRDSLFAANVELAAVFLPRARRLAERIGMEWPSALEAATRRHLRERLGLVIG